MAEDDPGALKAVEEMPLDWSPLAKLLRPGMVVVAVDAGGDALDELGLFDADVAAAMTADATAFAEDRAAELVGMKWDGDKLIPNPDAKWRIDEATRDMVRGTATEAVRDGWSNQRLASELADNHAFSDERAMMIARTETNRAQTEGSVAGWQASGVVGGKQWSAAPDCCDICQELDGTIVALDEDFEDGDPPLHPNCLPGDALVSAASVTAVSKRWYDGDVIVIDTASGKRLTCTPNHPILTPLGWIAAGLLDVGGDVISSGLDKWIGGVGSNDENVPVRIEDIAEAFSRSKKVTARPVPVAPEDFHGDGEGSEVAIIWSDRLLRNNAYAATCKHCGEFYLPRRGMQIPRHDGSSVLDLGFHGHGSSGHGHMGRSDLSGPLRAVHSGPVELRGLAQPTPKSARLTESQTDTLTIHAEVSGDGVFGSSGDVHRHNVCIVDNDTSAAKHDALCFDGPQDHVSGDIGVARYLVDAPTLDVFCDAIVSAGRIGFAGHVYNLETNEGYYVAQGVVTHNCACGLDAVLIDDMPEEATNGDE